MATNIQFRRGTASRWLAVNPVLMQAELGFETDTGKAKIGDGVSRWDLLSYWNSSTNSGIVGNLDGGNANSVYGGSTPINCGGAL